METDEYARVQSTRMALQALLIELMHVPAMRPLAEATKATAFRMAAEADRQMLQEADYIRLSEAVYGELEDLFRPISALMRRDGPAQG